MSNCRFASSEVGRGKLDQVRRPCWSASVGRALAPSPPQSIVLRPKVFNAGERAGVRGLPLTQTTSSTLRAPSPTPSISRCFPKSNVGGTSPNPTPQHGRLGNLCRPAIPLLRADRYPAPLTLGVGRDPASIRSRPSSRFGSRADAVPPRRRVQHLRQKHLLGDQRRRCSSSAVTFPAGFSTASVPVASLRNSTLCPR